LKDDFKKNAEKWNFFNDQIIKETFLKKTFDEYGKPKGDQLLTMTELKNNLNIRMENDEA